MKTNALYFPYIEVPNDAWMCSMLLYWDRVSSIVPYEFLNRPEKFNPFMRDLVREGLVHQVIPAQHIRNDEDFGEPFLQYVQNRLSAIQRRVNRATPLRSARPAPVKIHIEKIGSIAGRLERMGVARAVDYPWYEVEQWAGVAFMAYLATCLGRDGLIDAQPVTNDRASYQALGGMGLVNKPAMEKRRVSARGIVLKAVLPTPRGELDIAKIVRFKERHAAELSQFRNHIEAACIELANQTAFHEEQVELRSNQLREEVEDIASKMKTSWRDVTCRDVMPIIALAVSGLADPADTAYKAAAVGCSLIAAVRQFTCSVRDNRAAQNAPLAYAALANRSRFAKAA